MTPEDKPLCIDLFCGRGGWARGFLDAGYRVVGFDIEDMSRWYPGEFVRADVSRLDGSRFRGATVIVASPPCTYFSCANVRSRDPLRGIPPVNEATRIIGESGSKAWVIENVRGARKPLRGILGEPRLVRGTWTFWGRWPGFLVPDAKFYKGQKGPVRIETIKSGPSKGKVKHLVRWKGYGSGASRGLSMIPYPIARGLAEACKP